MRETFKISRLTPETPQATQDKLQKALAAVPGVSSATLKPETHEFVIENDGANRGEVIAASIRAGFHVQNNTSGSG